MHYLIVGGAGFIGSNLVHDLAARGHTVTVLDSFHTGAMTQICGPNGQLLPGINLHTGDAQDVRDLELGPLDGIFYTNGPSSSPMYRENPELIGKTINSFIELLATAGRYHCKLVFASSSSVYSGNPTPWREDMPIYPKDYYSEVRFWMERLAQVFLDFHGVNTAALRLFSVYGPNETPKGRYANLVSQAIWAAINSAEFEIYGDGEQARDYTHVDDVVRAFQLAMGVGRDRALLAPTLSSSPTGVFNVGTGRAVTLNGTLDLIDAQTKALGLSPIRRKYIPNPVKNYVADTLADTSKAEAQLGFKAEVTLEAGIARVISAAALDKAALPASAISRSHRTASRSGGVVMNVSLGVNLGGAN